MINAIDMIYLIIVTAYTTAIIKKIIEAVEVH